MKRRTFLQLSIPFAVALDFPTCGRFIESVQPQALSLVLHGGKVFYQGKWQTIDVGIDPNQGKIDPALVNVTYTPSNGEAPETFGQVATATGAPRRGRVDPMTAIAGTARRTTCSMP